ncbi:MAG: DUF4382 domain-containing protein [Candidatus Binatia bacterium]
MNSIPSTNSLKNKPEGSLSQKGRLWLFAMVLLTGITVGVLWVEQRLGPTVFSQYIPFPRKGTLEVRLKDHREAIGDFLKLEIGVDTIGIHLKGASRKQGWVTLKHGTEKVDLTRYTGRDSALIFKGQVTTGPYEAIDLKLKGIKGMLKKTKSKVPVKNLIGPIRLSFSVHPKTKTLIVLDLVVMDTSDQPGRGYELHIKGYELYTEGQLMEKIPPG